LQLFGFVRNNDDVSIQFAALFAQFYSGPAANAFRIFGRSTEDVTGPDTADGFGDISDSAAAGFQVERISVYSLGSALGNPDFINVQTNGSATVADDNSFLVPEPSAVSNLAGLGLAFVGRRRQS